MPRISRLVLRGEQAVYHVISRTALVGFVLGDIEKEFLLDLIKKVSRIYFAEVLGFSILGNHFHLLVKMHPSEEYDEEEVKRRATLCYGEDCTLKEGQIPFLREKWSKLSEYVKEIKQGFSRFYNRRHGRKGFFWSDRFKSVIVDNGETLINCLAYIDLNPVRAGIVRKPEEYRWCSLAYHVQRTNRDGFLSLDFGLAEFGVKNAKERLGYYRSFAYEKGGIDKEVEKRETRDPQHHEIGAIDRFRYRTRYFTDSGILGSKNFVDRLCRHFKDHFYSKHEKRPRSVLGLEGVFSLKKLSESI